MYGLGGERERKEIEDRGRASSISLMHFLSFIWEGVITFSDKIELAAFVITKLTLNEVLKVYSYKLINCNNNNPNQYNAFYTQYNSLSGQ